MRTRATPQSRKRFLPESWARLHELVDFGLVRRHRLLYNDGGLLTTTAEGLRCTGLDRLSPARISLALVPHMIASAALAAEVEPQLTQATPPH